MKTKILILLFTSLLFLVIVAACRKTDIKHLSANGATESHNMGQNCMSCHYKNSGIGRFYIAGTVYDSIGTTPQPNGKIEFYDALTNGKLVLTLEVDGNGNFYTANYVDFGMGLYPKVVSASGKSKAMGSRAIEGNCFSCHGSTEPRIWIEN